MSKSASRPVVVTTTLLRGWPLPAAKGSKYARGTVLVIGGAARSPGGAMLSGIAALRVGAGRLTLAVGESIAPHVAVSVMESGVVPLAETPDGHVAGDGIRDAERDLGGADAILVGPGLDDPAEAEGMLRALVPLVPETATVVLDAFALGVLPKVPEFYEKLGGRIILTPNKEEAGRLLGRDVAALESDIAELAVRFDAVVTCFDIVCDTSGRSWRIGTGAAGLGTSGSGDVLAGAVAGLCARGADPAQAAVWATYLHSTAGDRLAVTVAPVGYLASELLVELPRVLVEIAT